MYVKVIKPKNYSCWLNKEVGNIFEVQKVPGFDEVYCIVSGELKNNILGSESIEIINYKSADSEI